MSASTPGAVPYVVNASYPVGPARGLTPADIWSAYGLGTASSLEATGGPGTGQTIAVVDAYDDPDIESDLQAFDNQYGLPACTTANGCFTKVGQTGSSSSLPDPAPSNDHWDVEESLDVEAAHATCPDCKILLVEANSDSLTDLANAANEAATLGAGEISNSYGIGEDDVSTDGGTDFVADYTHPGVVVTASSGDSGYFNWDAAALGISASASANAPAALPGVVAVGGTTLTLTSSGARAAETVWNDASVYSPTYASGGGASGGGCSAIYAAPSWQAATSGYSDAQCNGDRLVTDVSADASPTSGLDIYDSYAAAHGESSNDWTTVGGTSLSSPLVAAMYALAGGADGVAYPAQTLYSDLTSDPGLLYDVTSGGNGYCDASSSCIGATSSDDCSATTACDAGLGFDGPSGVGAPANLSAFVPPAPAIESSSASTLTVGTAGSFTVRSSGRPTDALQESGTLPGGVSFVDNSNGTATLSGTPAYGTNGTYPLTITASNGIAPNATQTLTLTIQGPPAPSSGSAPTITGTLSQGSTLSEGHASWLGGPTSYSYIWEDCSPGGANCAAIGGATGPTYTLTGNDVGHAIVVEETATNSLGSGGPVSSAATSTVAAPASASGSAFATPTSTSTTITAAQFAALFKALGVPRGKAAAISSLLKSGRYTYTARAPSAGVITVVWYAAGPKIKPGRTGHAVKQILVARATIRTTKAGLTKVTVKLTAAGRGLLKHARSLKIHATSGFTVTGSSEKVHTTTFTLKR